VSYGSDTCWVKREWAPRRVSHRPAAAQPARKIVMLGSAMGTTGSPRSCD